MVRAAFPSEPPSETPVAPRNPHPVGSHILWCALGLRDPSPCQRWCLGTPLSPAVTGLHPPSAVRWSLSSLGASGRRLAYVTVFGPVGRPKGVKEQDVYICDYRLDKSAHLFYKMHRNRYPVCTKPYAFDHFPKKLTPKRDFSVSLPLSCLHTPGLVQPMRAVHRLRSHTWLSASSLCSHPKLGIPVSVWDGRATRTHLLCISQQEICLRKLLIS